jgi:Kef-type K+ transport system membrane component KefB
LEYTADQLKDQLSAGLPGGIVDLTLNFAPGLIAGLLLGWKPLAAVLLSSATYISSSGIIAKVPSQPRCCVTRPEGPRSFVFTRDQLHRMKFLLISKGKHPK